VVTFAYESWTQKTLPTNPKIFRIRHDVEWEKIVENFARKTAQEQHLNRMSFLLFLYLFTTKNLMDIIETSKKVVGSSAKSYNFWKAGKLNNMRLFFEKLFKKRNLDPRVATDWYSLPLKYVKSYQVFNSNLQFVFVINQRIEGWRVNFGILQR
jgi:hypothetical protein